MVPIHGVHIYYEKTVDCSVRFQQVCLLVVKYDILCQRTL